MGWKSTQADQVKVLIGMPAPDSLGGPISSEPPFVEALRGKDLDVVTSVYVYGDKLTPTPFIQRVIRVLRTAFRFRRLVRKHRPSVLFLNSAFDRRTLMRDVVSIFIMRPGNARVFIKLHGSMAEEFSNAGPFFRLLIKYLQQNVSGWGYHTREELEAFIRLGFDRAKFFPVRNAITIDKDVIANQARQQKDSDKIFELLFVARFVPTKGLLPTIQACEELRRRGVRFRLTCVGDGETRRDAEDAVGRFGLGRVVTFTGLLPETKVVLELLRADILVFPTSHPEGFPNALFRAVTVGLPIVTTRIRAAADYLSEPENCLYCTTDPANIADRIEGLIADKNMREQMSVLNIQYGQTLTPEKIAEEFYEIFRNMLGDTYRNDTN